MNLEDLKRLSLMVRRGMGDRPGDRRFPGRPHITFEDVERVALPALRHRLVMSYAAEAAGADAAQVVEGVLASARRARA